MTNRAVLIDLDGTLVDSAPDIAEAVNRLLRELGAASLDLATVRGFIGNGVPALMRRVLDASGAALAERDAIALFLHHYQQTNGRHGGVFPGVREGLRALRDGGWRLGCVTNKPEGPSVTLLAMHGLAPWFDIVVGGDTVGRMKPDPAPLLHARRMLDAAFCVFVGDSAVDVAAARSAGMPVLIVRYGYPGPGGHAALPCDGLIDSLEAVAQSMPVLPGAQ